MKASQASPLQRLGRADRPKSRRLPPEIWHIIAGFVPERYLSPAALISPYVLDVVRKRRFRSVCFDYGLRSRKKLEKLLQDTNAFLLDYIQEITVRTTFLVEGFPIDLLGKGARRDYFDVYLPRIQRILDKAPYLELLHWADPFSPRDLPNALARLRLKHLQLSIPRDVNLLTPSNSWTLRHFYIKLVGTCNPDLLTSALSILRQNANTIEVLGIPVFKGCLEVVGSMASLTGFRVTAPTTPELLDELLKRLPRAKLTSLDLAFAGMPIQESSIEALGTMQSLEEINIRGSNWAVRHSLMRSHLCRLKRLRRVAFYGICSGVEILWSEGTHQKRHQKMRQRVFVQAQHDADDEASRYLAEISSLQYVLLSGESIRSESQRGTTSNWYSPIGRPHDGRD